MPVPRVRVVTDSTSDIPEDIARQLDITIVPANSSSLTAASGTAWT